MSFFAPKIPKAEAAPVTDSTVTQAPRLALPSEDRTKQSTKAKGLDALRIDLSTGQSLSDPASGLNLPRL